MTLNAEEEKVSQSALNIVECRGRGTGRLKCRKRQGALNAEEEREAQDALNAVKCRSTCIKENRMAYMKRDVYKRD